MRGKVQPASDPQQTTRPSGLSTPSRSPAFPFVGRVLLESILCDVTKGAAATPASAQSAEFARLGETDAYANQYPYPTNYYFSRELKNG